MAARPLLACAYLILSLATVNANYEFTVHFYEFRNFFGLQCGDCLNGGQPACCGNQATERCTCVTRFRFMLRPFDAPVDTAPTQNADFPYITPSSSDNRRDEFMTGSHAFLGLQNPFQLTSTDQWNGRIQFLIDAIDSAAPTERLDIINRFPINITLELGARRANMRGTYTGIFNITGQRLDMGFRVQCSGNYYGTDCTIFCKPLAGVNTCDSQSGIVCIQNNRDPSTNCSTCLQAFLGQNCDIPNPCQDNFNPCKNGATCIANVTNGEYRCLCATGYEGTNCTEEINECLPNPCLNNGTCIELFADYQCTCPADFSGKNCDICECTEQLSSASLIRLASIGGVSTLSVVMNVILFIVVIVQCILISKKITRRKTTTGYQGGDDSIVTKPNLGYHGVNQRFIEESSHYYVNDKFGPQMRPDSEIEYHYTLM